MENIILDTTKKLQIQLKESATTQCDITVSYVDTNGSGVVVDDGAQESRSNSTTLQDILSSPSSGMRNALTITVVNNDTIQHTFYIYKVTGAGSFLVTEQTLAAGAAWDSNLNNNIFDWGAAIFNAASATANLSSKFGLWDFATSALRSITLQNLILFIETQISSIFMPFIAPGTSGNVLTSNGLSWTSAAPSGGGGGDFAVADGRLTLTSGTPVTTSDVIGATNIYYTPYKGTKIGLYDGSSTWNIVTFAETSLPLGTLTSGLTYDVFAYNNSGTLALELLAWTNATTRATALVYQNGILVKSGATTRRYIGTFYTTSTTTTEDSAANCLLYNYYNRVMRTGYINDSTKSFLYGRSQGLEQQLRQ